MKAKSKYELSDTSESPRKGVEIERKKYRVSNYLEQAKYLYRKPIQDKLFRVHHAT